MKEIKKEIGSVSKEYRKVELALQKATPAAVKNLVKELIKETLPMFEIGRNPSILNRGLSNIKAFPAWKKKVLEYFKLFSFDYDEHAKQFVGGMKNKQFSVADLPDWDDFLESLKKPKVEKSKEDLMHEVKKTLDKLTDKGVSKEEMLEMLKEYI